VQISILIDGRHCFLSTDISKDIVEAFDHKNEEAKQNNYWTTNQKDYNLQSQTKTISG
jgi:hypothetical protein